MGTITVKDATGSNQTAALVAATGSTSDANSLPVAQSTEHKALVGALTETAPANDTASSGLNGRLQRVAQNLSTVNTSLTSGYTAGKLISAASTNATNIKASAGTLGYITASNINAAARYLKIYNKASSPTVGSDVPVHVFLIPGNAAGAGTNVPIPTRGIALGTGISIAMTTGAADADTGAVAANEVIVNYGYL